MKGWADLHRGFWEGKKNNCQEKAKSKIRNSGDAKCLLRTD